MDKKVIMKTNEDVVRCSDSSLEDFDCKELDTERSQMKKTCEGSSKAE